MGLNQLTMRMSSWTLTVTALGAVTIRRNAVAAGPGPGDGGNLGLVVCPPAFGFVSTRKLKPSAGALDKNFWFLFLDSVGYRDNFEKAGLVPSQKSWFIRFSAKGIDKFNSQDLVQWQLLWFLHFY